MNQRKKNNCFLIILILEKLQHKIVFSKFRVMCGKRDKDSGEFEPTKANLYSSHHIKPKVVQLKMQKSSEIH